MTPAQVSMLKEVERDMDLGKIEYVVNSGGRWAMSANVMSHFSLTTGQSVSDEMISNLLKYNLEDVRRRLADEKNTALVKH